MATKPPEKLAIGLSDAFPDAHELPAIGRFQAMLPAIYDPILLLFYHLADSSLYGLVKGEPITAREIVERSEQAFNKREQDDYGNNWIVYQATGIPPNYSRLPASGFDCAGEYASATNSLPSSQSDWGANSARRIRYPLHTPTAGTL
jgi:hypothetical protein